MKQKVQADAQPSAHICINKSRLKQYDKTNNFGKVYLEKNSSFEIELYNPTKDVILAKISLNGKLISQSGLILKPCERVFLDRFIDSPKKFLFDTYEASGSKEELKAIEDNGAVKVEFFKEKEVYIEPSFQKLSYFSRPIWYTEYTNPFDVTFTTSSSIGNDTILSMNTNSPLRGLSKHIETGRIEEGGESNQKFTSVSQSFNLFPSFTVECKILPVSQMIVSSDLNVRRYCGNCSVKTKKGDKYCYNCGKKL